MWLLSECVKGSTVRKGTKLARVINIYQEGRELPIKLTNELRPLATAIYNAEEWISFHQHLLVKYVNVVFILNFVE